MTMEFERAKRLIPSATQTMSKSYTRYVQGPTPTLVEAARGSYLFTTDDKKYLDFGMGLGAVVLGYNNIEVNHAIQDQLTRGIIFSLPSVLEGETAEMLLDYIPWAEQVRFAKNGTDVTTAAVRLARAVTGKNHVICTTYHGWADWSLGVDSPGLGIPVDVKNLSRKLLPDGLVKVSPGIDVTLEAALDIDKDIAAVVVEVFANSTDNTPLIRRAQEVCKRAGALLILDEVLSGFRFSHGSAVPDITPDLACFGKALGNGMPISVLVGRAELMQNLEPGKVFFSGTAGGECLSLAACQAVLKHLDTSRLNASGGMLKAGAQALISRYEVGNKVECVGLPPRTLMRFANKAYKDYFQQECLEEGVLFHGFHNMAMCHTSFIVNELLEAYEAAIQKLAKVESPEEAVGLLRGDPSVVPYR